METISRALTASASLCSQEIKRFSLQLCSWGQSSCLPGTLPSSPAGQAPKRWDGSRDPPTHPRAHRRLRAGPSTGSPPGPLSPCGPSGFLTSDGGPTGTAGPLLSTVNNTRVGTVSRDRAEQQFPELPTNPSSWGPCWERFHPGHQVSEDDEMHSLVSQSRPASRKGVSITERTPCHALPSLHVRDLI